MKTVLYLIQAKAELPAMYSCLRNRNFVLLSYKRNSADTTIFAPHTTWTEGRNLLYKYVRRHNLNFDYYVFMDEDIVLLPSIRLTRFFVYKLWFKSFALIFNYVPMNFLYRTQDKGYKELEQSFELNYPIITFLYGSLNSKNIKIHGFTNNLPEGIRYHPIGRKSWSLQTINVFDAILVAVSKEVFFGNTLLPYTEKYDKYAWQISQFIFYIRANHFYKNAIIRNNVYSICNTEHALYPRAGLTRVLQENIYNDLCAEFQTTDISISSCTNKSAELKISRKISSHYTISKLFLYLLTIFSFPITFFSMVFLVIKTIVLRSKMFISNNNDGRA